MSAVVGRRGEVARKTAPKQDCSAGEQAPNHAAAVLPSGFSDRIIWESTALEAWLR